MAYPLLQPALQPAPQPTPSRRPLLLAALAGFLVAAAIAAVLVATGVFDSDSGDSTSTASISLPDKVDSCVRFDQVKLNKSGVGKTAVAHYATAGAKTAETLSAAHHGAGAAVQSYASEDLLTQFQIWAVRAPTTRPILPYEDPAYLGLAQPQNIVRQYGNSWCSLYSQPVRAGQRPPAHSYNASLCVRSSGGLSVIYYGGGSNAFSADPMRIAKAIDEIWASIS